MRKLFIFMSVALLSMSCSHFNGKGSCCNDGNCKREKCEGGCSKKDCKRNQVCNDCGKKNCDGDHCDRKKENNS